MLIKPDARPVFAHLARKVLQFRSDEGGAIAIFVLMVFVLMVCFGGIAVDVMRFETRRVALQETLDRAVLSASNVVLPVSQTPQSVGMEWFQKAGLGDYITYDYATPAITGEATTTSRTARMTSSVRSYNWFTHMLGVPYFEAPSIVSAAQQGEAKLEVFLVLDITGSMSASSGSTTKIAALRQAATNFVTILKFNKDSGGNYTIPKDPNNLISIGMVPYSSNVNIPVELRNQFNVSHLSSWNYIANQGVPKINCFEINPDTFNTMALSRTDPIPMAAVANVAKGVPNASITDIGSSSTTATNGGSVNISRTSPVAINTNSGTFMCNHGDNPSTGADESASNLVVMPATDMTALKAQIAQLNPRGNTSIAVGMRWGTALIDGSARPIYANLLAGQPGMAGRPADNADDESVRHSDGSMGTRKIIVVMTDGTHVSSQHIRDDYKSGPSPIWRGDDGNMAILYNDTGIGFNGGLRPGVNPNGTPPPVNSCSGWSLADAVVSGKVVKRNFFVPHLKANSVKRRVGTQAEGAGTGTSVTGGCDPLAWISATGSPATPKWTGSGNVRNLDWSEVWRYATVDWVIEQLYMRSNVTGATNYNTIYNAMVGSYLTSTSNMDSLLNTNCTAAKAAGVEVFGIILGDDVTEGPIQNCASPGTGYYYKVTNADNLNAAFEEIAKILSPLRLTE
ncbi:MAG: Tad domain-containing protein [Rhodobacterales bacterium]|nr:Tad domain-containing protein [Rhodobacterales bacterium]